MVGIGLGAVVVHKAAVGEEGILAAGDWGCGEEVHMAAAAVEGMLLVGGMDCVRRHRMVAVDPDCTGFGGDILPVAAVVEVADLVHILLVPRILEGVRQAHRSPAGAGNLVAGNSETGTGLSEAAGTLLPNNE